MEAEVIRGLYEGEWEQRRLVPLSQLPPTLTNAILAAEDHRFYQHHGIDPKRIIKAAWIDFISGRVRQGGSTLTHQLMKNFFLTQKRGRRRKHKQIPLADIPERRVHEGTSLQ